MSQLQGGNSIDEFRENLKDNMEELENNLESIDKNEDRQFATQLCEFYDMRGYLSHEQIRYAVKYLNGINSKR